MKTLLVHVGLFFTKPKHWWVRGLLLGSLSYALVRVLGGAEEHPYLAAPLMLTAGLMGAWLGSALNEDE